MTNRMQEYIILIYDEKKPEINTGGLEPIFKVTTLNEVS